MELIFTLYIIGMGVLGGYFIITDKDYTLAEVIFTLAFYPVILLVWGTFVVLLLVVTLLCTLIGAVQILLKGGKIDD